MRSEPRLFNALVQQLCVKERVGFVYVWGRVSPFICEELKLNGMAAASFAEELQRTFDHSMGNSSYLN